MTGTLVDRTIDALRVVHDDLAAQATTLGVPDLQRTSGSTEWPVGQVFGHLGSAAEIALSTLRAALAGEEQPGPEFGRSVWDRWDAMGLAERAGGFVVADEALVATLEGLDDETRTSLRVAWFLPEPVSLEIFAGSRLGEVVQHAWDIAVAGNPHATLPPAGVEPALDLMTGPGAMFVGWFAQPERWTGADVRLLVRTLDPDRDLGLSLGTAIGLSEPPAEPDAVLTLPAEAFLRLLAGRLRPEHTPPSVTAEGIDLDQLRAAFPGY